MSYLTQKEYNTLNAAFEILRGELTEGQYWNMSWHWTKGCNPSFNVLTCTPLTNTFHHWLEGETFADKIETGLRAIAEEAENYPTPEDQKAERMRRLRAELAELEAPELVEATQ